MKVRFTWAILVGGVLSGQVSAQGCSFCPGKVTLSKGLAACYLDRFETELARAQTSGLAFHMINLSDCAETSVDRGQTMPDPRGSPDPVDTSFLIEPDAMVCLARRLEAEDFDPDDIVGFDIEDDCDT